MSDRIRLIRYPGSWLLAQAVLLFLCSVASAAVQPSRQSSSTSAAVLTARRLNPAFTLRRREGDWWLFSPEGNPFFSLGVCCVHQGTPRHEFDSENPSYAAWQQYGDGLKWADVTLSRLKSWGFSTIGAWSDHDTLCRSREMTLWLTPVLHMGATAGAPWWDMWDPKIIGRMDDVAREQILAVRDDPRLLGYYSDNEMGWWNATLFKMTLEQAPTSGQRKRLLQLLREHYDNDWNKLLKDF